MQHGKKLSFGASVLGALPADDCAEPSQYVPDSWRALLVAKHLDGAARRGVLRSCRAGQQLVLQTAPAATLQLNTVTHQEWSFEKGNSWLSVSLSDYEFVTDLQPQRVRQLSALRDALRVRCTQPTALTILCNEYDSVPGTPHTIEHLPDALLAAAGYVITHISLVSPQHSYMTQKDTIESFLATAAPHLPNLRSLDFTRCVCVLPPPQHLPSLRRVCVHEVGIWADTMFRSTAPYLGQITHLSVTDDVRDQDSVPWPLLFKTASHSDTAHTHPPLPTSQPSLDHTTTTLTLSQHSHSSNHQCSSHR